MAAGAVQAALLLHLHDDVLDHLFFVLVQLQGFLNAVVALHQLGGGKPHRDARRLGVILDEVDDAVDAAVHRAAVVILAAEVHAAGPFPDILPHAQHGPPARPRPRFWRQRWG